MNSVKCWCWLLSLNIIPDGQVLAERLAKQPKRLQTSTKKACIVCNNSHFCTADGNLPKMIRFGDINQPDRTIYEGLEDRHMVAVEDRQMVVVEDRQMVAVEDRQMVAVTSSYTSLMTVYCMARWISYSKHTILTSLISELCCSTPSSVRSYWIEITLAAGRILEALWQQLPTEIVNIAEYYM